MTSSKDMVSDVDAINKLLLSRNFFFMSRRCVVSSLRGVVG